MGAELIQQEERRNRLIITAVALIVAVLVLYALFGYTRRNMAESTRNISVMTLGGRAVDPSGKDPFLEGAWSDDVSLEGHLRWKPVSRNYNRTGEISWNRKILLSVLTDPDRWNETAGQIHYHCEILALFVKILEDDAGEPISPAQAGELLSLFSADSRVTDSMIRLQTSLVGLMEIDQLQQIKYGLFEEKGRWKARSTEELLGTVIRTLQGGIDERPRMRDVSADRSVENRERFNRMEWSLDELLAGILILENSRDFRLSDGQLQQTVSRLRVLNENMSTLKKSAGRIKDVFTVSQRRIIQRYILTNLHGEKFDFLFQPYELRVKSYYEEGLEILKEKAGKPM